MAIIILIYSCIAVTLACDGSLPLGLSTGQVQDDAITASSTYPSNWDAGCDTKFARLLRAPPGAAWCSSQKSASEWLQADLGFPSKINSVATQGRTDGREWVTAYQLSYSIDGKHWHHVRDRESDEIRTFAGNADSHAVKHNYLEQSIIARFVKFHPIKWHGHPSMRIELFGCQDCTDIISVQPWAQIKASSQWLGRDGNRCRVENAFLYSSGAWCPKKRDNSPWIEYDFGPSAYITAIATRGKEPSLSLDMAEQDAELAVELTENGASELNKTDHLPLSSQQGSRNALKPQWVSGYKLLFRNFTDQKWSIYEDPELGEMLEGNDDGSSIYMHYLAKPFVARYVRLVPLRWVGYPSMRIGIHGCSRMNEAKRSTSTKQVSSRCPETFLKPGAETPCVENLIFKKKAWSYMKRHHKRHLPTATTQDKIAEKAVDGNVNSSISTCMPLNNAQVADPTWMVDIGKRSQVSGVLLWLWHPTTTDNSTLAHVERGLRWLDKIIVFVTAQPVNRASNLNNYEGKHLCSTVKNFDNRFAKTTKPIHFICENPLVGRYIYVVAIGSASSSTSTNSATKFHTSICEVQAYS